MIVDCISDLHGTQPELEGGDLLIIAGDLTARDEHKEYEEFVRWLAKAKYRKIVIVAGNHDTKFVKDGYAKGLFSYLDLPPTSYLCDSSTEFEGYNIYGSPWTRYFEGMNPDCAAFTCHHDCTMTEKWDQIPEDTDILVTHSPPKGILDETSRKYRVGCEFLRDRVRQIRPALHIFGHIHEAHGQKIELHDEGYGFRQQTTFVNASQMNKDYKPTNKPIRIIL